MGLALARPNYLLLILHPYIFHCHIYIPTFTLFFVVVVGSSGVTGYYIGIGILLLGIFITVIVIIIVIAIKSKIIIFEMLNTN